MVDPAIPNAAFQLAKITENSSNRECVRDNEFGAKDYTYLQLRKDHHNRPLWIAPTGKIYLEAFSPVYKHAHDFLIAISEVILNSMHLNYSSN